MSAEASHQSLTPVIPLCEQPVPGHADACVRRLLDLVSELSPESHTFTKSPPTPSEHARAWLQHPSVVTWTLPPNTERRIPPSLPLRLQAVSLLRTLATLPSTASAVNNALAQDFSALAEACESSSPPKESTLAPILIVGGTLNTLLSIHTGGSAPRPLVLRDDVVRAFLRACGALFGKNGGVPGMLGRVLRSRMMKALWEVLASPVRWPDLLHCFNPWCLCEESWPCELVVLRSSSSPSSC